MISQLVKKFHSFLLFFKIANSRERPILETKFSLTLNACVLSYKGRGNINLGGFYEYLGYFICSLRNLTDEMFTQYIHTYILTYFLPISKSLVLCAYMLTTFCFQIWKKISKKINDRIHTYYIHTSIVVTEKYSQNDFRSETPPMWCVQEGF